jgi:hypothetical protein
MFGLDVVNASLKQLDDVAEGCFGFAVSIGGARCETVPRR